MKTLFIYTPEEGYLRFFVKDGDYSYLDNIWVNNCENEDQEDELIKILEEVSGKEKELLTKEMAHSCDVFITVGWVA